MQFWNSQIENYRKEKYGKCGDYHIDTLCNGRIKISKQNEEEK